jgi:hypothetical protein
MMTTDQAAEYTATADAWERRSRGVETLQSLPLAALFLVPLCSVATIPDAAPRTGDVIGDLLGGAAAIVSGWAAEIERDGDIARRDLAELAMRLDVVREVRRRERLATKDGAT